MTQLNECQTHFVHEDIIETVTNSIPEDEELYNLADFLRMVGDSSRIKILHALFISEMCVCDLSALLQISQSAMSHQLKTLRQANIVKYRKEGKTVFYSLKDHHVKEIIDMGLQHIREPKE